MHPSGPKNKHNKNTAMTKNITADFIQSHSLMDCLREFDGAHSEGDKAKVEELNGIFYLLAQKMLYGGYFAVYKDGVVARRIYINCVEFYYHEERDDGFKDWIVYHRNPVNGKNKKAAFPLGSLHSHVSGVDITFEDQKTKADDVRYRASALIREFMVTNGDNEQCGPVDIYPTHLYEYLYTQSSLEDIHIQWKPVELQHKKVTPQRRINVCTYTFDGKTLTKKRGEKDLKAWGSRR